LASLQRFNNCFTDIAEKIGVRLASQDVPDKAFGPQKTGTVFGIFYDTENWTWSIPQKKMNGILVAIQNALQKDSLPSKEVRSLMGKLINIKPLIPTGKYTADHLMAALGDSQNQKTVKLTPQCKTQLRFWALMLKSCNGKLAIPSPADVIPPWAKDVYTDAAGGTLENIGRGVGGVCGPLWFYYPWSKPINSGHHKVENKKLARKLAALEIAGPLVALSAAAKHFVRRPVNFWVDNAGTVGAWRKGYSASCKICTTVIKAIAFISAAIGARVDIKKITRCSNTGAVLADHLSKANFADFRRTALETNWPLHTEPLTIPTPLLVWLHRPVPDENLGPKIVQHLAAAGEMHILGYHDQ
jgi:hypothetical protein